MRTLRRILVTGGAGFIGSNFIHYWLERHDSEVINLDLLTYAGNLENLADVADHPRYRFVRGDIADRELVDRLLEGVDAVVNFAAESHVDRSIHDAGAFIRTNVAGTQVLLEAARHREVGRFMHISTDEVYGSLGPEGAFTEQTPLAPNSPYSASKAAADLLVRAYHHTYGLDAVITRCSNNYGPYQFPEKLIPLMVTNALEDKELPVYGDGLNIRDWIHVRDHCRAIDLALHRGRAGEVYNVGAGEERTNLELVREILRLLGKPESRIRFVKDRPGHDRRYAIDSTKLRTELGWRPEVDFARGLAETVEWYMANRPWWEKIKSGEYREYYARMYGDR
ncbi:MAG: dTDP-glucose 4,6-dehydratase [Bacillota bacterium]|nr:dTDP-glucose 4,6-dehydratase [Bacillota bacterium]